MSAGEQCLERGEELSGGAHALVFTLPEAAVDDRAERSRLRALWGPAIVAGLTRLDPDERDSLRKYHRTMLELLETAVAAVSPWDTASGDSARPRRASTRLRWR